MADNIPGVQISICAPDDPNRCQGATAFGQCNKLAIPGTDRCAIHKPSYAAKENEKAVNGYLLGKWQSRLDRLADNNGIRSLRSEIGVLKMTLESVLNTCHDHADLIDNHTKIISLVDKIEKVVLSCNRLEKTTGMMMDKSQALQIAGNICTIIGSHIDDPALIESITDEIIRQVLNVEETQE